MRITRITIDFEYKSEKHRKTSTEEFTCATVEALMGPFESLSSKPQKQLDAIKPVEWSFRLVNLTPQMYFMKSTKTHLTEKEYFRFYTGE